MGALIAFDDYRSKDYDRQEIDVWINERTGEKIEARTVFKRVERKNFEILYLSYACDLFDKLGGKKYKILKYLLANKDYNNIVLTTTRKLSKDCHVALSTVTTALKLLKDLKVIATKTGAIMINPRLLNRGSTKKEEFLIQKFEIFDDDPDCCL